MNWFSFAADVASVVGLGITIAILIGITNLKESYVARITVPPQLEAILKLRDRINEILNGEFDENSKNEILVVLSEISAQIENLSPKVKIFVRSRFKKEFEPEIKKFTLLHKNFTSSPSKELARDVTLLLLKLTSSIRLFVNDDNWRNTK